MKKSIRIVALIFLAALLGVAAWQILQLRQPVYAGKSYESWLAEYSETVRWRESSDYRHPDTLESNQVAAIRAIGTNGIPTLLRMLRSRDSALKRKLAALIPKKFIVLSHAYTDIEYHNMAVNGFQALGSTAKPAVPALIGLVKDREYRYGAALSLGKIGPDAQDAVPSLIPCLSNNDRLLRYFAAEALGEIGPGAKAADPALFEQLSHTDFLVRSAVELALAKHHAYADTVVPILIKEIELDLAVGRHMPSRIKALGAFGVQAKSAIPLLLRLKAKGFHYDEYHETENALKEIDPTFLP